MPESHDNPNWNTDTLYVIGHQRPDTDAIAAAVGFTYFLLNHEKGETYHDVFAARTGPPSAQATYALERFDVHSPVLLTSVAPTFMHIVEKRYAFYPQAPLSAVLERLGDDGRGIPVVDKTNKALGFVSPMGVARTYARGRQIITTCKDVTEPVPAFRLRDRLSDHRMTILRSPYNEFLVLDEDGDYVGVGQKRDVIYPPKAPLYLVDHNELSQAVSGAEEAEVVGVLDHHRLGNPPTAAPIPFTIEPVGSTSTLVAEHCVASKIRPPRGIAGMLLSGILSDTLTFRSPTTTPRDKKMAEWLGSVCTVDILLYGKELLSAAPGLLARTPTEILEADRKLYEMGGVNVALAQIEVTGMQELPDIREAILSAMEDLRDKEQLGFIGLMVTDVIQGQSRLLATGETKFLEALPYPRLAEGEYDLEEIVSRKKQLAPDLQGVLEMV
jgi:manganese-dependent inorganic pyrophosphatase